MAPAPSAAPPLGPSAPPPSAGSDARTPFCGRPPRRVPPDRPLVFVVREEDVDADVEEIVRQALSIGYEDLAGYLEGGVQAWQRAGLPVAQLAEMTAAQLLGQDEAVLLDVRQRHE